MFYDHCFHCGISGKNPGNRFLWFCFSVSDVQTISARRRVRIQATIKDTEAKSLVIFQKIWGFGCGIKVQSLDWQNESGWGKWNSSADASPLTIDLNVRLVMLGNQQSWICVAVQMWLRRTCKREAFISVKLTWITSKVKKGFGTCRIYSTALFQ